MADLQLQKILKQLSDHEERIRVLEESASTQFTKPKSEREKRITLREFVKGKKFKNGQEQIAVIVGFHEKTMGLLIDKGSIKKEWVNAKMMNKYNGAFINRATDEFIRVHPDGKCDLTQTGEKFFEGFLKHESTEQAS